MFWENRSIFAPAIWVVIILTIGLTPGNGPFVYRLGRKIFILERGGVRFPYGLLIKKRFKHTHQENGKSQIIRKRIRQTKVRRLTNRYASRTTRNKVRKLRAVTSKEEAIKMYPPEVCSMLDKLAKKQCYSQK